MAMASELSTNNRVLEWAKILRQCRTKVGYSHHRVADVCGVSIDVVRSWENGEAIPNHYALKQLNNFFPRLRHYSELLPKPQPIVSQIEKPEEPVKPLKVPMLALVHTRPQLPSAKTPTADSAQRPKPPAPESSKETQVPAYLSTFRTALSHFHDASTLSTADLARKMNVTGSTIFAWRTGRNYPILDHYEKLLEIFPGLKNAPRPDVKDWDKPDSSGTPKSYNVPLARQPVPPPIAPATHLTLPAPTPPAPPEPVAPVQPPAPQIKPDIGALGVAYATSLGKMNAANAKVEDLIMRLLEAEDELKAAKEETNQAHEALKKATGAP
jgi:DNA-binding transcriptional regulator YiaG